MAAGFWLLVWELASRAINREVFLASPGSVILALSGLCREADFWSTIGSSFLRIVLGFFLGLLSGILLAVISFMNTMVLELVSPLMKVIKATPVASFIILALVWISSGWISVLVSFLMVLPVSYVNVLSGLQSADIKLLQMAKVFRLGAIKKITAIYLPAVLPYLVSAISLGLGFGFKSGIAAEVIGRPSNSIGLRLYEAKLYLMTRELFAWTVVIIIISVLFEHAVLYLIRLFEQFRAARYKTAANTMDLASAAGEAAKSLKDEGR